MQPVEFPQQTVVLAKDQPEYIPLPVYVLPGEKTIKDEAGNITGTEAVAYEMTACFQLDPEEIAEINATGKLWFTQCVFGNPFQPVRLSTRNPFEEVPQLKLSPIRALVKAFTDDPDYRETWKANIAMAFKDAYSNAERNAAADEVDFNPNIHTIANEAADNFLNTLCTEWQ